MSPALAVWLINSQALAAELDALDRDAHVLPAGDLDHASGSPGAIARRHAWIATRLLLWSSGAIDRPDAAIARMPGGKPILPHNAAAFSLAHSGNHVLVAIAATGMCGVDVEGPRVLQLSEARRALLTAAGLALAGVDADAAVVPSVSPVASVVSAAAALILRIEGPSSARR